ncbi:cytosolic 5'-nucleotidase 1B isoform X2 [Octodon degus]|uniref:Cytosolic 5'-nucleotidase 1B isoform X2 n=1 Tax=Octodon degus TaxID=10160 RepID=A0A6P6E3C2_OCTDE|nr:cytosolic 5'-nucleotidase 1B isoform X2 [Octodon degus]
MSQTSLKQKKNEPGTKYSKESLDSEKRRESEKSGVRLSTQMRHAGNPSHSLRCCPMRGHPSCRRCLCAAGGAGPCRSARVYIHMCLMWEQGQQTTMIRGSQELSIPKTNSRGQVARNQWSRTSGSPSSRPPSVDESRSRNTNHKHPSSSTTSRTSSASPSQHEESPPPPPLSVQPSPQVPTTPAPTPTVPSLNSLSFSAPDYETPRRSKMRENPEAWAESIVRDLREPRDSRSQPCDYPVTPPTEWRSYAQRRLLYGSNELDRDCLSELQPKQLPKGQTACGEQEQEEEETEEAYWASVKKLYEKIPSCARPRPPKPKHAITIAVSSRALFNMVEDRRIYEKEGLEKYMEYQLTNENVVLTPGPAFRFVKALQHVNARLRELYPDEQDLFDIVLMTNNHAQVGVRLINSVNHYGLLIDRFCLTGGKSPIGYLKAYLTNLYLSASSEKVQEAIKEGIASATMFDGARDMSYCDTQLRVAFDGDAVLFSDESEHIAKEHGLDKFFQHETMFENKPLAQGPLKGFLEDLGRLQKKFYAKDERLLCPIRTYLVTARSAASSGARVLKTLRRWGLEIDEALFLAGAPKGPILVKIRPHIFFDDQMFHIEGAQKFGTITAHVPYGVGQKYNT